MGAIEDFEAWLLQHDTTRKFLKGLIIYGITFAGANQATILFNLPQWVAIPLAGIITAAANYVQTHNTLPIFGVKASTAGKIISKK